MGRHDTSIVRGPVFRRLPTTRRMAVGHSMWAQPALSDPWRQLPIKPGAPCRDHPDLGLARFIEESESITEMDALFERLVAFAEEIGCPWVAYASLTSERDARHAPVILQNYPAEWKKRYIERGYCRIDPILWRGRRQAVAFNWNELCRQADMTVDEKRVCEEAAAFGLKEGIGIPFHGPNGRAAIVSFSETQKSGTESRNLAYLQAASYHFHATFSKLSTAAPPGAVPDLSRREQECLLWAAEGKSSWDTGRILGISENTVNFHVKNVMRKFGTSSRTVAIVKALRSGLF